MPNFYTLAVYLHLDNIHQGINKIGFSQKILYKKYE